MASLTGQTVSSTYDGLLKTTDNDVLNAGAKEITDGLGNGTGMTLSTTGNVGISGNLTVDGAFKDSSGNGGTIGQVLVSTSIGTNWVDSSEVNAVDSIIAGDGISVDTATGNVTITNTITNNNQLTNGAGYVDGSGTANYVPKWTDGNTIGNSVIYDDGANVGIGTSNPSDKLEIAAPNSQFRLKDTDDSSFTQFSSSSNKLAIRQGSTTANHFFLDSSGNVGIGTSSFSNKLHILGSGELTRFESTSSSIFNRYVNSSGTAGYIGSGNGVTSGGSSTDFGMLTSGNLVFAAGGSTEKMRIDSSGNVGIGESDPDKFAFSGRELHIKGGTGTNQSSAVVISSSQSVGNQFLGGYYWANYSSTNEFQNRVAQITVANGTLGADYGNLSLFTKGGAGDFAERMRIDSSGNVNIKGTNTKLSWERASDSSPDIVYLTKKEEISTNGNARLQGYDGIVFSTAGTETERMRILSSGDISFRDSSANQAFYWDASSARLGLGTTSPLTLFQASETVSSGNIVNAALFSQNSGSNPTVGQGVRIVLAANNNLGRSAAIEGAHESGTNAHRLSFLTSANGADPAERMRIASNGIITLGDIAVAVPSSAGPNLRFVPAADGTVRLGDGPERWEAVYAVNGTIITSDGNEKQDIENLEESELNVAKSIKGLIKKFKYKDAVSLKGEDARIHIGVIAQEVKAAFEAEGLDASRYAMFCSDTWWEKYVTSTNEEGVETSKREVYNEPTEGATERTRLGIRYDELLAFVISAL